MDVYLALAEDIKQRIDCDLHYAQGIVSELEDIGVIDYDTLKEIYLNEDED